MRRIATRIVPVLLATLVVASRASASDERELVPLTAEAAIAVDVQTGDVYFARNETLPLPPASTTKLLTAIDRPAAARRRTR